MWFLLLTGRCHPGESYYLESIDIKHHHYHLCGPWPWRGRDGHAHVWHQVMCHMLHPYYRDRTYFPTRIEKKYSDISISQTCLCHVLKKVSKVAKTKNIKIRVTWEQIRNRWSLWKSSCVPLTWDPPSLRDMMRPESVCRQYKPLLEKSSRGREFLFVSLRPLCSHIIIFGQNL